MAAYETAVCSSSSSPHANWSGRVDRTCGLSIIRSMLSQLASPRWSPAHRIEPASPLYRSAHRQQCLRGLETGASGANRTLIGRLPCDCSATELHRLEPKGGFEPPSELYEGSVFPLNYFDLERVTGFEPVSGPWQGPILAARRYPPGASGENRTLLASLEGWHSTNKSHSLDILYLHSDCQRTHFDGSAWTVRSLQPCAHLPDLSAVKTHWSGTPDSNRDLMIPNHAG